MTELDNLKALLGRIEENYDAEIYKNMIWITVGIRLPDHVVEFRFDEKTEKLLDVNVLDI